MNNILFKESITKFNNTYYNITKKLNLRCLNLKHQLQNNNYLLDIDII